MGSGELLVQVSPAPIVLSVPASFTLPIPGALSGLGSVLATQGVRVDTVGPTTRVVLLNALDLVLGL